MTNGSFHYVSTRFGTLGRFSLMTMIEYLHTVQCQKARRQNSLFNHLSQVITNDYTRLSSQAKEEILFIQFNLTTHNTHNAHSSTKDCVCVCVCVLSF